VLHVLRLSQVSDGFLRLLIPVLRTRHGANIQLLKRQWTETNVMTDLQIVVRFFLLAMFARVNGVVLQPLPNVASGGTQGVAAPVPVPPAPAHPQKPATASGSWGWFG
jgi:hypothetical protein